MGYEMKTLNHKPPSSCHLLYSRHKPSGLKTPTRDSYESYRWRNRNTHLQCHFPHKSV